MIRNLGYPLYGEGADRSPSGTTAPKSDRIQTALDYASRNLRSELSVEELAEAAHLSPRQFSRTFRAEAGQSPPKRSNRCAWILRN